MFAPCTPSSLR